MLFFLAVLTLLISGLINIWGMSIEEASFNNQLSGAIGTVRQVLHNNKFPAYPADVPHAYDDKFTLAEVLTQSVIMSNMNSFKQMAVVADKDDVWLGRLIGEAAAGHSVWLSYSSKEHCYFNRTEVSLVDTGHAKVEEVQGLLGTTSKTTKVQINITKHYWDFSIDHALVLHSRLGAQEEKQEVLFQVRKKVEKVTSTESPPYLENNVFPPATLDITWWLKHIRVEDATANGDNVDDRNEAYFQCAPVFTIDRHRSTCYTPRRNPEVAEAERVMESARQWASNIWMHLHRNDAMSTGIPSQHLASMVHASQSAFHPVRPLMYIDTDTDVDECAGAGADEILSDVEVQMDGSGASRPGNQSQSKVVGAEPAVLRSLLREEVRSFWDRVAHIQELFQTKENEGVMTPSGTGVSSTLTGMHKFGATEVRVLLAMQHWSTAAVAYSVGARYIEEMMHRQLVAAVGKEVSPADLLQFMNEYHMDQALFRPEYATKPFTYAVRRSVDSSPEGFISIEQKLPGVLTSASTSTGAGSMGTAASEAPIRTMMRRQDYAQAGAPELMNMRLSAGTSIRFGGERYVHGWLHHQFSSAPAGSGDQVSAVTMVDGKATRNIGLSLVASARQFSSFILVVGRVASNTEFVPQHALLVRDKDVVRIPLFLESIPNAQEFQDFIRSLSPTQRAFAESYRQMQLQHSLLGILVIQIKPQLERVLNLPDGALTKEIQLTRDLMELLVDYQIPSDLLSHTSVAEIVAAAAPVTAARAETGADTGAGAGTSAGSVGVGSSVRDVQIVPTTSSSSRARVDEAVTEVKRNVAAMKSMIAAAKEDEIRDRRRTEAFEHPRAESESESERERQRERLGPIRISTAIPSSHPSGIGNAFTMHAGEGGAHHGQLHKSFRAAEFAAVAAVDSSSPKNTNENYNQDQDIAHKHQQQQKQASATVAAWDVSSLPQLLDKKLNNRDRHRIQTQGQGQGQGQEADDDHSLSDSVSVQANILHVGPVWTRMRQHALNLVHRQSQNQSGDEKSVSSSEQKEEWVRVLDLLDMITKSGAQVLDDPAAAAVADDGVTTVPTGAGLDMGQVSLHVLASNTCRFEDSIIDSIIRGNVNPIQELDNALAVMAATIHNASVAEVLR